MFTAVGHVPTFWQFTAGVFHPGFESDPDKQKEVEAKEYLKQALTLHRRCKEVIDNPPAPLTPIVAARLQLLGGYCDYVEKSSDQIDRRLLKGEVIPSEEKVFSIFEEHTEWITKGKLNKKVELGHLLLITTDQYQFIVDYKIMQGEKDAKQIQDLQQRLDKK
jgi:hypothetical protein